MRWFRRLQNWVRSRRLSRDLDREMAFHLAERTEELVAGGMAPAEAAREARRRFGNRGIQKEDTRAADVPAWLDSLAGDVRYAIRSLRASPGFALVVIVSLGLGIGANTAIFGLIDSVMLKSLPVVHPEELVQVTMAEGGAEFTNPIWEELRDRQRVFTGVFAVADHLFDLGSGAEERRVRGSWVSGGFFTTLGVRPVAGRLLTEADDVRGCPAVAVVSYDLWQNDLGGDPAVVGRAITIDGHPFAVAGVVDPSFFGMNVGSSTRVYLPLCTQPIVAGGKSWLDQRSTWFLHLIGRPRPGLPLDQVRRSLAAVAPPVFAATVPQAWRADMQGEYRKNTLTANPAATGLSSVRGQYRGALLVLMTVVGVVLLIACANVANLLLARATVRRHEIAVRLAIGAGRARLVRQLLTESLLLSALGAVVGGLLAGPGSRLLVGMLSTRTDSVWLDLGADRRVLAFTVLVAAATAVLFGLAPAFRSAAVDPQVAMKANPRNLAGSARAGLGRTLVIGQIALSMILVVIAGLFLGTFRNLVHEDPGFRADGVLVVSADLDRAGYPADRQPAVRQRLLERLRTIPGVRAGSASARTPFGGWRWNEFLLLQGATGARPDRESLADFNAVSPGYFGALGIPLLAGRDFTEADRSGSLPVAIVSRAMARKFYRGKQPIGKRFRLLGAGHPGPLIEIIGLVGDSKFRSLREPPAPTVFIPLDQAQPLGGPAQLLARAAGSAADLVPMVEAAFAEIDRSIPLDFVPLSRQVTDTLVRERLLAVLAGFFGGLALLLAVVGLYGVMAYGVARRRGEIGVRIALGAGRGDVGRMVLSEVGAMVVIGTAIGAAISIAGTRLLGSLLFGLGAADPRALVLAAVALALAAAAAGALPAWRASKLDPMAALREE